MTRSIVLGHVLVAIVSVAACGEPAPPVALTMTNGQGEIAGEVTTTSVILQTRLTSRGGWVDGDLPGAPGLARFEVSTNPGFSPVQQTAWLDASAMGDYIVNMVPPAFGQDSAPPRTPDGQPSIQGVWTNFDPTPFEAPDDIDLERLAPLARWFPGTNQPQRPPDNPSPDARSRGPRGPWGDGPGDALRNERRRSTVVDPPNGRAPLRDSAIAERNQNLVDLTDGWLTHTPWERCITRGVPGGMFPGGYGAGYQILQAPGYVVLFYEMIHEARVIPIDDRPPLSENIRLWNGNARGRWEGETLVVETANYNNQGTIGTNIASRGLRGIQQSQALKIVERFTRADADTIEYEVTIDDPGPFTAPWTVAMPLNRDMGYQIYEYACHEGNYGLENSLRSGRAEDDAAGQ